MVTVFSNTNSEPACLVSRLKFGNDNNVDNVQFQRLGWLIPQRGKKSISEKKKNVFLQLPKSNWFCVSQFSIQKRIKHSDLVEIIISMTVER